jgi:hypothetical protein
MATIKKTTAPRRGGSGRVVSSNELCARGADFRLPAVATKKPTYFGGSASIFFSIFFILCMWCIMWCILCIM